jgi:CubicO group peptidase (beta-lactamase class C family)
MMMVGIVIGIFEPLDMKETSWFIRDLNVSKHAVPYTYVSKGRLRGGLLQDKGIKRETDQKEGFLPNCLYSFPNYPDGLVRTSVRQIARFLMTYINNGVYKRTQILKEDTIQSMLSDDHFGRGLCWSKGKIKSDRVWGHGGGDPGISTIMHFRPSDGTGVIVFANTGGAEFGKITPRLYEESTNL